MQRRFRQAADSTRITARTEPEPHDFVAGDRSVRFHACPCPSKHGHEHAIGWVADAPKPEGMLHIGLAHGNAEWVTTTMPRAPFSACTRAGGGRGRGGVQHRRAPRPFTPVAEGSGGIRTVRPVRSSTHGRDHPDLDRRNGCGQRRSGTILRPGRIPQLAKVTYLGADIPGPPKVTQFVDDLLTGHCPGR